MSSRALFRLCGLSNHITARHLHTSEVAANSRVLLEERCKNGTLFLTINRPKALNALNLEVVTSLRAILAREYQRVEPKQVIVLRGEGKSFCAGGDVRALRDGYMKGSLDYAKTFLKHEYMCDYLVRSLNRPNTTLIFIMDGYTMGGGLGLSIGSKIRVITEKTLCAMPETAIGLFPDVGGTWFLSHDAFAGALGLFVGLTGHRLSPAECIIYRIATHHVPSDHIDDMMRELREGQHEPIEIVKKYSRELDVKEYPLKSHEDTIRRCFSGASVGQILNDLKQSNTDREWCQEIYEILRKKSPLALEATFELFKRSSQLTVEESFALEYRACLHFQSSNDFPEGVRAVVVDKDNQPRWSPSDVSQVTRRSVESLTHPVVGVSDLDVTTGLHIQLRDE